MRRGGTKVRVLALLSLVTVLGAQALAACDCAETTELRAPEGACHPSGPETLSGPCCCLEPGSPELASDITVMPAPRSLILAAVLVDVSPRSIDRMAGSEPRVPPPLLAAPLSSPLRL